ncbi:succinate dehydrogenase assembly factor 2 [Kluyveromyces marxianus DMKU3-1042]|uniref:Succinate dehydrogenase assembly factor 2, mitochondrial n=1 Tax=Kluyveromyces marxianus (strain DMKU3-1042 / BCC 29191 / NBRC 104275) TaxID=1003335 RepID=W0TFV5_KLUMD|nr:succinate dehydrogenase assembly factor 2 [Kluyveromyces marxianus DMKU3-1042]BAO42250.1 succinate dehydrogenase assembly factor 2 [Kluyveromyces marxianus DMKU3-1042]
MIAPGILLQGARALPRAVPRAMPRVVSVARPVAWPMARHFHVSSQVSNGKSQDKSQDKSPASSEAGEAADEDDVTLRIRIPPIERTGESLDRKRARLIYQSRKRGILETDLLLSRFAAKYLKTMSPEELQEYDELLNELDWDIYYWATENYSITPLPDKWKDSKMLKRLQEFSKNKDREILSMPDLSKY